MRVVAYLRTSGLGQVDKQGSGVQEDACRAHAAARGWTLVAVLHEAAVTGNTEERPCWAEALVMIERGEADGVVLSSLDRLARTLTCRTRCWSGRGVRALRSTPRTSSWSRRTTQTTRCGPQCGKWRACSPSWTRA